MVISSDAIMELRKVPLIPGIVAMKEMIKAGAFGYTMSGVGSTMLVMTDSKKKGKEPQS